MSDQESKPSLKFGTGGEFGTLILLLLNKGVQSVGSQCLTQGQMAHILLQKTNEASARQPKLPSIAREKFGSGMGKRCGGGVTLQQRKRNAFGAAAF